MATLTELCADVYTITGRPDLVAETKLAVRAATLKAHQSDFYLRDLQETGIQFLSSDYVQQFDVYSIFPRYRALKYLRRYDSSGTGRAAEFYEILTPNELLDSYGNDKLNVAYLAGTTLNIKSYTALQFAILGCYLNPDVTEGGYTSWIADNHPFLIQFEAARVLFKSIGFDEQSTQFQALTQEQLAELKLSNIQSVGY